MIKFVLDSNDLKIEGNICLYFYSKLNPLLYHRKVLIQISQIEKFDFSCIDIDNFPDLKLRFNVNQLPTIIVFKNSLECFRICEILETAVFKNKFEEPVI